MFDYRIIWVKASHEQGEKRKKIPLSQSYLFLRRGNYQLSIINYQLLNSFIKITKVKADQKIRSQVSYFQRIKKEI